MMERLANAAVGAVMGQKLTVGKDAPDFTSAALMPDGTFKDLKPSSLRGKYVILLFYPQDWTFVCPTEIIAFSERAAELKAMNCVVIGISVDSKYCHLAWTQVERKKGGLGKIEIPLVEDVTKSISRDYGVLIEDQGVALRGLFVIDPKGKVRSALINDLGIGRSVPEAIRLVQAIHFNDTHGEVCPANWEPGRDSMKSTVDGSREYFVKHG